MNVFFKKFIRGLLAIYVWVIVILATTFVWVSLAIFSPFDRDQKFSYRFTNLWGATILGANPFWRIRITGKNHIKKTQGFVLVANHASLADIICLYCLWRHFKWLAKESLFKIPVFGWTMSLMKYIPLERGRHGSIRDSFETARQWLEKDISVLIFPEGTRSKSGKLSEFKNGAFKLALLTGKSIVPIVIQGTEKVMTKGRISMGANVRGSVKVFEPIDKSRYQPDAYEALKKDVWELMSRELTASAQHSALNNP